MIKASSLLELRERARAQRRDSLLAAPIDDACSGIEDAELAAIVRFVAEKLGHEALDDLLASSEAERAFQRALSPPVRARLFAAIEAYLFASDGYALRMAVRESSEAAPEPPRTAREMETWAREHGIEDRLERPASVVLDFVESGAHLAKHPFDAATTVTDVLNRRRLPTSATSAATLTEAARAYLRHEAHRRKLETTRAERWASVPRELDARRLSSTLGALRTELVKRGATGPARERLVRVDIAPTDRCITARFVPPARSESRAEIEAVVTIGEPSPSVRCPCPAFTARGACMHALDALAVALDATHDAQHPLHAALMATVTGTRSGAMADRLAQIVSDAAPTKERDVVFRLELGDGKSAVTPLLRRRHRDGTHSAGAAVAYAKLLDDASSLEPTDVAIAALGRLAMERPNDAAIARALVRSVLETGRVVDPDDPKRMAASLERALTLGVDVDGSEAKLGFHLGRLRIAAESVRDRLHVVAFDEEARSYVHGDVEPRLASLALALAEGGVALPLDETATLVDKLLLARPPLRLELPESLAGRSVEADTRVTIELDPLGDGGLDARLVMRPLEDGPSFEAGDGPSIVVGVRNGERVHVARKMTDEIARADDVDARLELGQGRRLGVHAARFFDADSALALVERIGAMGPLVRVEWPPGKKPYRLARATGGNPSVRAHTAGRWLGVEGELETTAGSVSLASLLRAVRTGKRFVALGDGAFLRLEESLRERVEAALAHAFETDEGLAISAADLAALEALAPDLRASFDERLRALEERMVQARTAPDTLEPELDTVLRDYQRDGFRFLARLSALGFGALLADEMGLGKTVQSLALLAVRAPLGPALVIAPTSVVEGWAAEASKFARSLDVRVHLGQRRATKLPVLGAGDVLVTSYELLARDIELIGAVSFATAIFDEAHYLKNARTRRSDAARRVVADARIGLTGTPLENHLSDLFGIFDVISPGLLGTANTFRDRYALPIERHSDMKASAALRARVGPYVLRRTKAEVAIELPDRLEVERAVDLSPEESLLYEAARREAVLELGRTEGSASKQRFAVLAALTRLRQLACHPRLVDPASAISSSKLESFLELAHDLVREGHRALVFSQFVRHLDLVREALDASGYDSLRLDGGTPARDRSELVRRFQTGATPFFLVSLKAGGTGLNLTAADYVIHLDPWWNPASEDQASDRAHRIGQTQPVTIVRLVANGTIERAVLELHRHKRSLADALLSESSRIARADLDELVALING